MQISPASAARAPQGLVSSLPRPNLDFSTQRGRDAGLTWCSDDVRAETFWAGLAVCRGADLFGLAAP